MRISDRSSDVCSSDLRRASHGRSRACRTTQITASGGIMPYIACDDGVSLHYRFDGPDDAPVLVMSNSLGTDLGMWEPQMPALIRKCRVLRYDTLGTGL